MAVDDVYSLTLNQLLEGQQLMNVLTFRRKVAADPTSAECLALANDWKDAIRAAQVTYLAYTTWTAQQIRGGTVSYTVKPCLRDGGLRIEGTFTAPVNGTATGDGLPPQAAVVTT